MELLQDRYERLNSTHEELIKDAQLDKDARRDAELKCQVLQQTIDRVSEERGQYYEQGQQERTYTQQLTRQFEDLAGKFGELQRVAGEWEAERDALAGECARLRVEVAARDRLLSDLGYNQDGGAAAYRMDKKNQGADRSPSPSPLKYQHISDPALRASTRNPSPSPTNKGRAQTAPESNSNNFATQEEPAASPTMVAHDGRPDWFRITALTPRTLTTFVRATKTLERELDEKARAKAEVSIYLINQRLVD